MKRHEIKTMPLSALTPASYNPRSISSDAMAGLTASVRRFGLVQPIVWNKRTKRIVGGHQRVAALKAAGEAEASVVVVDLPEAEEKALNVALNNPHIEGQFTAGLQDLLHEIKVSLPDAFNELKLEELFSPDQKPEDKDVDEIPPLPKKATTKKGDLWILGDHRLLCGDATEKESVGRLFGSEKADVVFTDPPYGVSYEDRGGKFGMIKNDDLRDDGLLKLLVPSFKNAAAYVKETAAFYIWHASSTREDFAHAMKAAGLQERQYLIWVKPNMVMGHSDYRWAHEPCFYASKEGKTPEFYGDRGQSTVWHAVLRQEVDLTTSLGGGVLLIDGDGGRVFLQPKEPTGRKYRTIRVTKGQKVCIEQTAPDTTIWEVSRDPSAVHPTQKPVELARRALENSSKPGQIVYDPFLGSGTSLIGAERTGRRCFGLELDPKYADVIVERWQQVTGKTAHR